MKTSYEMRVGQSFRAEWPVHNHGNEPGYVVFTLVGPTGPPRIERVRVPPGSEVLVTICWPTKEWPIGIYDFTGLLRLIGHRPACFGELLIHQFQIHMIEPAEERAAQQLPVYSRRRWMERWLGRLWRRR